MSEMKTLSPKKVFDAVKSCFESQIPVMIWGPPGVGKSAVVESLGRATNRNVIDLRLLLMDPTDLKGIPFFNTENSKMEWAPSAELPQDKDSNDILFLDEINAANPQVQAAAYQLVLNRRIGQYKLPEGVSIVAAGNRENDRGIVYTMPSPLSNRFLHIEMESNFNDWMDWAIESNVHNDVVAYLSYSQDDLFNFDPKSNHKAFATPRTWEYTSNILKSNPADSVVRALVAGCIGDGLTHSFMNHRKIADSLPDASKILDGSITKIDEKSVSVVHTIITSLCSEMNQMFNVKNEEDRISEKERVFVQNNFVNFLINNFDAEHVVVGIVSVKKRYKINIEWEKLEAFDTLFEKYSDVIM